MRWLRALLAAYRDDLRDDRLALFMAGVMLGALSTGAAIVLIGSARGWQ